MRITTVKNYILIKKKFLVYNTITGILFKHTKHCFSYPYAILVSRLYDLSNYFWFPFQHLADKTANEAYGYSK